jgi:hypothetical protein
MKIYLKKQYQSHSTYYLQRDSSRDWVLMCEEPKDSDDFDWMVRELDEFEADFVESVFQHFAEPMKKLTGE